MRELKIIFVGVLKISFNVYSYICFMEAISNKELVCISRLGMSVRGQILSLGQHKTFCQSGLKLHTINMILLSQVHSLNQKFTSSFGKDTMLGSLSREGVSAQPCLSANHKLNKSGSLVARLLAAVHGVS